jgi:uncharacterized protein (DUF488 family)
MHDMTMTMFDGPNRQTMVRPEKLYVEQGISGIGYEGLTPDALLLRLRAHAIEVVADIRLNAVSRKPGFSKKALSKSIAAAGICYMHLPTLGNPRDNRTGYAELATPAAHRARRLFCDSLKADTAAASLLELADLARARKVAVLCFETDARHCHREQVIAAVQDLLDQGLVGF